jgi:hypothetical protein
MSANPKRACGENNPGSLSIWPCLMCDDNIRLDRQFLSHHGDILVKHSISCVLRQRKPPDWVNRMTPLHRKIKMLAMIPREPGTITAGTVKERLADQGADMDIRTIQRDLQHLSGDFPIACSVDPTTRTNHWFFIKDAKPFDIPAFSPITALSFNLVERFLKDSLPQVVVKQLSPHFGSAADFLSKLKRSSWVRWAEKIRFVPRGQRLLPVTIDPAIFEMVSEGLWREKQLQIQYESRASGKTVESRIHPIGLVFRFGVVYLVCTFWDFQDIRQLALHRFRGAEILENPVVIPPDFDLDRYITQEEFAYPLNQDPLKLKLLFDSDAAFHLRDSKLSDDQELSEQGGGKVLLTATVKNTSELFWWLRGFGDLVEVLEPQEIRSEFSASAKRLAGLYGRG